MKIAVLLGGKSAERDISLKTGNAVAEALITIGHLVKKIDPAEKDFICMIKEYDPEIVFIALHGLYGEDGTIQGLLEILGYPYTGCNVLTSALAMNKIYCKRLLNEAQIPTPNFIVIKEKSFLKDTHKSIANILREIKLPLVIKAPNQGSSIGIYFAKKEEDILKMILEAFKLEKEILIEEFIEGREVTVAVMGNDEFEVLPIIEIVSNTGVYDYRAKYTKGLSEHIIPARITDEVSKKVAELAVKSYAKLGCKGFARVDFIIKDDEIPYVLEINTVPGMTETSLFPDAARSAGLCFEDLIEKILYYAKCE